MEITLRTFFISHIVRKHEKHQISHFAINFCQAVGHPIIIPKLLLDIMDTPFGLVSGFIFIYFSKPIRDFGPVSFL